MTVALFLLLIFAGVVGLRQATRFFVPPSDRWLVTLLLLVTIVFLIEAYTLKPRPCPCATEQRTTP